MRRIFKKGGELYRVCNDLSINRSCVYIASNYNEFKEIDKYPLAGENKILGPWRVKPGGLAVILFLF